MVLAPDPPSDMLDGWGAAEPEEQSDDLTDTGITLIEAVSETGEYVVGDEAGMRLRALETRLKQFLELDDLTDALEVVEQILELEPEHGLALEAVPPAVRNSSRCMRPKLVETLRLSRLSCCHPTNWFGKI